MSLDVYLTVPGHESEPGGSGIFVREDGRTREITRAEWNEKFPDREPVVATAAATSNEVFTANITHNLGRMADAAGIYQACWRPDEIGIALAAQLVPLLRTGLERLTAEPDRFREFNPSNGWGTYEGLVEFVREYLAACEKYPHAQVSVWR